MSFIADELTKPPWEFNLNVEHEVDFTRKTQSITFTTPKIVFTVTAVRMLFSPILIFYLLKFLDDRTVSPFNFIVFDMSSI